MKSHFSGTVLVTWCLLTKFNHLINQLIYVASTQSTNSIFDLKVFKKSVYVVFNYKWYLQSTNLQVPLGNPVLSKEGEDLGSVLKDYRYP